MCFHILDLAVLARLHLVPAKSVSSFLKAVSSDSHEVSPSLTTPTPQYVFHNHVTAVLDLDERSTLHMCSSLCVQLLLSGVL